MILYNVLINVRNLSGNTMETFSILRTLKPHVLQASEVINACTIFLIWIFNFKGKLQQKFLSSHLKETPKQYIEVYYRILRSALFHDIF